MNHNKNLYYGIDWCDQSTSDSGNSIQINYDTTGNIVWIDPNDQYYWPTNTINYPTTNSLANHHSIMDLPVKNKMPISVFVCGRMITLGIIGSNVECAYINGQLIFMPGTLDGVFGKQITVSIEYNDAIYHYNLGQYLTHQSCSKKVDAQLVSTISKDSNAGK